MKNQSGFTLIELVIVIVLLGVLSAIAVPRFVNLEDDAQRVSLSSTANAITSAMNINYAECAVNGHAAAGDCRAIDNCDDAASVMNGGAASLSTYTIASAAITGTSNGSTSSCVITRNGFTSPTPVTFTAVRAGT